MYYNIYIIIFYFGQRIRFPRSKCWIFLVYYNKLVRNRKMLINTQIKYVRNGDVQLRFIPIFFLCQQTHAHHTVIFIRHKSMFDIVGSFSHLCRLIRPGG